MVPILLEQLINELKDLVGQLDKDKIQGKTAQKGVKWTFNPPGAPHFGGARGNGEGSQEGNLCGAK